MNNSTKTRASQSSQQTFIAILRFALPPLACLFLFWPLLFKGHILAFRDALHFYYPLWKHLDAREYLDWLLPQFNYFDYAGVPIVGEPTSMIFYPPRLLLRLPWLGLERCIGLFLSLHLCICWYSCYFVARSAMKRSILAASLLSTGYAFGGATYFNIYNPPYLVSACWLPLAIGAIAVLIRKNDSTYRSEFQWQILLTISVAAMILGGDVQTPYNLAILVAIAIFGRICLGLIRRTDQSSFRLKNSLLSLRNISQPFIMAGLLCAIQLLPTYSWFQLGATKGNHRAIGSEYVLHFVDLFTWFVPLGLGNYTPTHTRWIAAYDTATMWTPSLHMAIPLIASLVLCWRLWKYQRIRWMIMTVLVCVLAALGEPLGLYSAYSHLLPFYEFRFPIKWYSIAAFMLCLLGAYAFDLARRKAAHVSTIRVALFAIGGINTMVVVAAVVASNYSNDSLHVPSDRLCGAFDLQACRYLIASASFVTACGSFGIAWMISSRLSDLRSIAIESMSLLAMVVIAWLMTTTIEPGSLDQHVPPDSTWQTANESMPVYWTSESDAQKSADSEFSQKVQGPNEVAAFQRRWSVGKMHLLTPGRSLFAQLSLTPSFYQTGARAEWLQSEILPESETAKIDISLNADFIDISSADSGTAVEIRLPILNDGGWSCNEPGAEIASPENHLLVVRLPEGAKDVKLSYCAPGLAAGAWISFLALIVFVLVICKRYV